MVKNVIFKLQEYKNVPCKREPNSLISQICLSSVQLMQNKDNCPIPTNGLRLSTHNRTKIQNASLSFTVEKLKSH